MIRAGWVRKLCLQYARQSSLPQPRRRRRDSRQEGTEFETPVTTQAAGVADTGNVLLDYHPEPPGYVGNGANYVANEVEMEFEDNNEHTTTETDRFQKREGAPVERPFELVEQTFENAYTSFLPSIHLTLDATEALRLRAAWSNTIGRPEYDDRAAVDYFPNDGFASVGGFEARVAINYRGGIWTRSTTVRHRRTSS